VDNDVGEIRIDMPLLNSIVYRVVQDVNLLNTNLRKGKYTVCPILGSNRTNPDGIMIDGTVLKSGFPDEGCFSISLADITSCEVSSRALHVDKICLFVIIISMMFPMAK
jgi:hypothetical protein